jgi:hypothetical protein
LDVWEKLKNVRFLIFTKDSGVEESDDGDVRGSQFFKICNPNISPAEKFILNFLYDAGGICKDGNQYQIK